MKNQLNVFILFLITLSISLPIWADLPELEEGPTESCDNPVFNFPDFYNTVISPCIKKATLVAKCKCIQEDMKKNEFTRNSVEKGYTAFLADVDKNKEPYFHRFNRVYEKVTIQAAAQEEVLGLTNGQKAVGCTPLDMAKGVREKRLASIPAQIEELKELKDEALKNEVLCRKGSITRLRMHAYGCDFYSNRADMIQRKIDKMETDGDSCQLAMDAFKSDEARSKIAAMVEYYSTESFVATKNDFGLGIQGGFKTVAAFWNKFLNGENVEELIKKQFGTCSEAIKSFNVLSDNFERGQNRRIAGAETIAVVPNSLNPENQCPPDDSICNAFAVQNVGLLKNTLNKYEPKPEDCVTYAEYATYKGMPSQELLKQFAKAKNPEDLLNDTDVNSKTEDRVRFLQANPLIAVVAKGGNKKDLGLALKNMATNILAAKGGGEKAAFNGYLDFMKNDFNGIYANHKNNSTMTVCNELSRNYAAIQLSNDLPPLEDEDYSDDPLKKNGQVILRCIGRLYRDTGTTKLDYSLKLSPIYVLGADVKNPEPTTDGFENFKKNYCEGYAEHRAKNCLGTKDQSACRGTYNKSGKLGEITGAIAGHGIKSVFDQASVNGLAGKTDVKQQDDEYKTWWDKEVGSKLSKQAIASHNDNGEFAAAMQANHAITDSPDIQDRYEAFQKSTNPDFNSDVANKDLTPSSNVEGGFDRSSEDANQVRPQFDKTANVVAPKTNFNSLPPETIKNATDMTQLDPAFNNRPVEEKLSTFKALQDFVKEGGPAPEFSVSKEIENLEKSIASSEEKIEKIEAEEKEKEKEKRVAQSNSPVNRAPANFNQQSFTAPISSAPVLSQFPKSTLSAGGKINKAEASYQAALLQKHQLSPDLQIMIQGNNAEAPYIVPEKNIVKADEQYPFESLQDPAKLSEFLAIKLGNGVKNGESVKIVNPKTNDYFVMKATKKNGVTSYQLIPFVKKEAIRIVTLGNLNNEIDVIQNQK